MVVEGAGDSVFYRLVVSESGVGAVVVVVFGSGIGSD